MSKNVEAVSPASVRPWFITTVVGLLVLVLSACSPAGDADDASTVSGTPGATEGGVSSPDSNAATTSDNDELVTFRYGRASPARGTGQAVQFSLPAQLGFWEEEGIEMVEADMSGAAAVMQALVGNQIDIGLGDTPIFMKGQAQGVEMTSFFAERTSSYLYPGVPEDSDITSISDLQGKRIGVSSLDSMMVPLFQSMMTMEGYEADSIELLPIGGPLEQHQAMEAQSIDVYGLWRSAFLDVESIGGETRPILPDWFDDLGYNTAFWVNPSYLEENPDILVGFARGIAKSLVFANENPEAAVLAHWEFEPESRPSGVPEDEALEQGLSSLGAYLHDAQPVEELWGNATPAQVELQREVFTSGGFLSEEVDLDALWTDEFIEEINDFDAEAVREMARNWEPSS